MLFWVSSDRLESVFWFCGLRSGALDCAHAVRRGVWGGKAAGFWLPAGCASPWGCTCGALSLRELTLSPKSHIRHC